VKRLLPRSLVGQLLTVVALMLLIAQAINMLLLYRGAQTQNMIEASTSAVARMAGEMHRMDRPEFDRRRDARHGPPHGPGRFRRAVPILSTQPLIAENATPLPSLEQRALQAFDNMGFAVRTVRAARVGAAPSTFDGSVVGIRRPRRFAEPMGRAMGQRRHRPDITGFVLMSAQLPDGRWMNIASAIRDRDPGLIRALIVQTVVLYLILLLPLVLLGRYISRPLKALTQSAETFSPGDSAEVEERGPPDEIGRAHV